MDFIKKFLRFLQKKSFKKALNKFIKKKINIYSDL
jgi:hypothetical protein